MTEIQVDNAILDTDWLYHYTTEGAIAQIHTNGEDSWKFPYLVVALVSQVPARLGHGDSEKNIACFIRTRKSVLKAKWQSGKQQVQTSEDDMCPWEAEMLTITEHVDDHFSIGSRKR